MAAAENIETNVIANESTVANQSPEARWAMSILGAEDSTSTTVTRSPS